ncbi:MAG: hypothetical protein KDC46_11710 [Thermoleophilia bacterium]|nr:hypothetical protein [Thermoleophilia bacterium]
MDDVRTRTNDQPRRPVAPQPSSHAHARYRPVRSPLQSMGPSLEEERRRQRVARLIAVASVVVVVAVVLLVWVVGMLGREVVTGAGSTTATAARGGTAAAAAIDRTGAPTPQTLASAVVDKGEAQLRLQLPIRSEALTGIGFGPRREPGVIELEPAGTRANTSWLRRTTQRFLSTTPAGDLRWFQLGEGTPEMVVVGALPETEVYAPIDGKVVAITPYVLDGEQRGVLIQLQPTGDGQTLVVLRNLDADPELLVGTTVTQSVTRLGTVRDMEGAVETPLADYTHDTGSGIDIYVLRISEPATERLG